MTTRKAVADTLNRRHFLGGAAAGGMAALVASSPAGAAEDGSSPPAAKPADLQWMNLTSELIPKAIEDCKGVCLVPLGCLERHGPHLPLGTDTIQAEAIAVRASEIEPAVVFPGVYFGQIAEARHCPGTISLDHDLLFRLLRATLDEIGRNGFTKIMIVNGHGGNNALVEYLRMSMLQERKPYVVYSAKGGLSEEDRKQWEKMSPEPDGHAGPGETSMLLHLRPKAVRMDLLRAPSDGDRRDRLKHLDGVATSFSWYANYPTHLASDPRPAAAERGAFYLEARAKDLARQIKAVKDDATTPALAEKFYGAAERRPQKPPVD